jgi:hypothetical protein
MQIPNMDDDCWKEQFELMQINPVIWTCDADSLVRSFEILSKQAELDLQEDLKRSKTYSLSQKKSDLKRAYLPQIEHNALMLGALATEVMLKGIALNNPTFQNTLKHDRNVCAIFWTHNIQDIAEFAEVDLNAQEKSLCEQLECFLLWAGRYSVPMTFKGLMPRPFYGGGTAPPNLYSSGIFKEVRELTERLRKELPVFPKEY